MNDVIQAPEASGDLASHYSYIAEHNPDAARRFSVATEKTFALLAEMPGIGAPYKVKNPHMKELRRALIKDFRNYTPRTSKVEKSGSEW